ncbi:MAG TPA: penicillin acylase family protein [Verrucomicrobiae bacterium]|nr:penicillin acylase family protein [Verrucomicrobiae bacterium]
MTLHHHRIILATFTAAALLAGCNNGAPPQPEVDVPDKGEKYNALVRRTALGIPHIRARDFGSLGYGLGYAQAEDNLCVLMDDIITDRGERARYFGADGRYVIPANGSNVNNVDSDFFWKLMITPAAIATQRAAALPDAAAATSGFKDGFNRYIREIKADMHEGRHAACRGANWLFELEDDDMYRRYIRLGLIASSSVFAGDIATAQPPSSGGSAAAAETRTVDEMAIDMRKSALSFFAKDRPFGSNMYALGSEATTNGMPIVFGNPHFPWSGTERLYIFHATLAGGGTDMDIMGAALYGVPAVLIGFNDHFAWSHTVSTAYRFGFYELTLSPESPTSYVYDGEVLQMEAVPLTIQVKQADGSLAEQSRTLYKSKFGPMTRLTLAGPDLFPWTDSKAYTIRDANFENDRLINQFFHWNKATSLNEFIALHKSVLGIPWVNTIASGPGGKAYYGDVSVVPNVPDSKAAACSTSAQAQALAQLAPGLPLLDGSRADCEWDTDEDAPAPGIFGPGNLPTLERNDWVHNCNDSYWLTHPAAPLAQRAAIIGDFEKERSLRTRLCIQQVLRHLDQPGDDGLGVTFDANGDKKFDLKELQDTVLSSQIYSAQLGRNAVTGSAGCTLGSANGSAGPVNVSEACDVLDAWTLQSNLADVGPHIWREFFGRATSAVPVAGTPAFWNTPFLVSDPVNTPRGLNAGSPPVQEALADAVKHVKDVGIALDAPLGSLQRSGVIGNNVVPVFGGEGGEGAFTIVSTNDLDADGYRITYGNSYIQTVTWEPDAAGFKPIAEGFITYSQSTDPASPHFFDFTQEYSAKRWHRFPFREADVAEKTVSMKLLSE